MKRTTLASVVAVAGLGLGMGGGVALADKAFNDGKGATVDCSKDPKVAINAGGGSYTFKGKCKSISVNGNDNTLTIDSVDALDVNGNANAVTADALGAANVNGNDNKIGYKKSTTDKPPRVAAMGDRNKIDKK